MKRSLAPGLAILTVAAVSTLAGACQGGGDAASATDTLTRRQKDSLISTMPIPGSRGVGSALDAQDRINARAAEHDSIND